MRYSCIICGKQELTKDTVGINKKLLGTDIVNLLYGMSSRLP